MNRRGNVAETLACGLAGDVVRTFGDIRLRVFGTSMVPAILPGDVICVQRAGLSEISSGDIVLYEREGRLFAHRVVSHADRDEQRCASPVEPILVTRGDRLLHDDPPVTSNELLGRVTCVERGDERVCPSAPSGGFNNSLIRILRTSDYATYAYLRLGALWRSLFSRRTECRV